MAIDWRFGTRLNDVAAEILDGPNAGRSTRTDAGGSYSLTGLQPGVFTMRFSGTGREPVVDSVEPTPGVPVNVALVEVGVGVASCVIPTAPRNVQATASGRTVAFTWDPPVGRARISEYRIEISRNPAFTDIVAIRGAVPPATSLTWNAGTEGVYYAKAAAASCYVLPTSTTPVVSFTV